MVRYGTVRYGAVYALVSKGFMVNGKRGNKRVFGEGIIAAIYGGGKSTAQRLTAALLACMPPPPPHTDVWPLLLYRDTDVAKPPAKPASYDNQ